MTALALKTMTKINDHRIENLRRLMREHDGPSALAAKLDYANGSFLVQMAGPNPSRPITEATARKIEEKLKLPVGYMDEVHEPAATAKVYAMPHTPAPTNAAPMDVSSVVMTVMQLLAERGIAQPDPQRFADLVALAFADATEHGGVRRDYLVKLCNLVR